MLISLDHNSPQKLLHQYLQVQWKNLDQLRLTLAVVDQVWITYAETHVVQTSNPEPHNLKQPLKQVAKVLVTGLASILVRAFDCCEQAQSSKRGANLGSYTFAGGTDTVPAWKGFWVQLASHKMSYP